MPISSHTALTLEAALSSQDAARELVSRINSGGGSSVRSYRFGAFGEITTGQKLPSHYVDVAGTAYELTITVSAGTVVAQIEKSINDGDSWTTVDTVSLPSGRSNTNLFSHALTESTLLRVNYTAASGCSNPVVTLLVESS